LSSTVGVVLGFFELPLSGSELTLTDFFWFMKYFLIRGPESINSLHTKNKFYAFARYLTYQNIIENHDTKDNKQKSNNLKDLESLPTQS